MIKIEPQYSGLVILLLTILSPFISIGIFIPVARSVIIHKKNKYIKYILIFYLLIINFLLLFIEIFDPPHNSHDKKYNEAFYNWTRNKTTETKATLDRETYRIKKGLMIIDGVIMSILIINAFGIYRLVKYKDRKSNKTDISNPSSPVR